MRRAGTIVASLLLGLAFACGAARSQLTEPAVVATSARDASTASVTPAEAGPGAGSDSDSVDGRATATRTDATPSAAPTAEEAVVVWSADGRAFFVGRGGHAARVQVESAVVTLDEPRDTFGAAAFSPDGARLVTVGQGGLLTMRDGATGAKVADLLRTDVDASARTNADRPGVVFSHDGKRLATWTDLLRVWDVATRALVCTVAEPWADDARFSAKDDAIVATSLVGNFGRFDATTCAAGFTDSADTGGTFAANLAPSGEWVASSEQGHGLAVYRTARRAKRVVNVPTTSCQHHVYPSFSPDGTMLLAQGDWFRSFRTDTLAPVGAWTPKGDAIADLAVAMNDGLQLVLQGEDAGASILDVRTPTRRRPFDAKGAHRFVPSPDSKHLLGITATEVHVWRTATLELIASLPLP